MLDFSDVFSQTALILFLASVVGLLSVRLKQPLIVGFIAVGILLGPSSLGWVQANDQIDLLAKLGISLLLFIVGLKLDLHIIKTLGQVALATGIGQVVFTSLFGYLIALALGFDSIESLYIAVALTFSSTIIIVKLLSDKREVDSLHGRIAVGFLIVQDLLVILAMIVLNSLNTEDADFSIGESLSHIALSGTLFILGIGVLMRYVLPPLLESLAQSRELLMVFAIAWAVSLSALDHWLGFSKEVGAFIAGVSLASTPYREVIGAKLVGLRDFLLLFFFVDLGATLDLSTVAGQLGDAAIFSLFVLIGNPLIVMAIMGLMGYRSRTGFMAGLTVAQISEFSLILAALGVSLGHIGMPVQGLITLVGLVTISVSTYMILYAQPLYAYLAQWLGVFERARPRRESATCLTEQDDEAVDLIVIGLGRFGRTVADRFIAEGYRVLGIDFDPERVRKARTQGIDACYGDASDEALFASLPIARARWFVSAVHDPQVSEALAAHLKAFGFAGQAAFAVQGHYRPEKIASADTIVFAPYEFAARHAAEKLLAMEPKEPQ